VRASFWIGVLWMCMDNKVKAFFKDYISSRQAWLILGIYIAVMIALAFIVTQYIDRSTLHTIVDRSGAWGIGVFLIIEYLYVIFVPIYNTAIHIASGYIFGGQLGWIFNFVATTAGLFTIILLVKSYGRLLLEKVVSNKFIKSYDSVISKIGIIALFIMYVLPLFPDDEITYLLAVGGKIQFWRFIIPVVLGNVAKTAVSYIGDEGLSGFTIAIEARVIILVVGLIIIGAQEYWLVPKLVKKI